MRQQVKEKSMRPQVARSPERHPRVIKERIVRDKSPKIGCVGYFHARGRVTPQPIRRV